MFNQFYSYALITQETENRVPPWAGVGMRVNFKEPPGLYINIGSMMKHISCESLKTGECNTFIIFKLYNTTDF